MPTLSDQRLRTLLEPYLSAQPAVTGLPVRSIEELVPLCSTYLDLLMRWNARTNLTAVRDPEAIVQRHFGESLFAGLCLSRHIGPGAEVLDLGSGAGFPGVPIQALLPELRVTLAESQGKKAAFLREAARELQLPLSVWGERVERLPAERLFDAVTLRAVDRMSEMVQVGWDRVQLGGWMLEMTVWAEEAAQQQAIPGTRERVVVLRPKV